MQKKNRIGVDLKETTDAKILIGNRIEVDLEGIIDAKYGIQSKLIPRVQLAEI